MNIAAIALIALFAQQDTIATANDPRVGLRAGTANAAGVAAHNMRAVAFAPKPAQFDSARGLEHEQLVRVREPRAYIVRARTFAAGLLEIERALWIGGRREVAQVLLRYRQLGSDRRMQQQRRSGGWNREPADCHRVQA